MGKYVLVYQGGATVEIEVDLAGGCPIIADGGTVDGYETIDVGR
jgi:hypothetical protein